MQGIRSNSTLTAVFRKVEAALKASDTLKGAVIGWRAWKARDGVSGTEPPKGKFTVELFPFIESQTWESPSSHSVLLAIEVRLTFDSKDAGDYLDVWTAVIQAVYPTDQAARLALQQTLREAGCVTGEPEIQWPTPVPEMVAMDGRFEVAGHVRFEVRFQLNT